MVGMYSKFKSKLFNVLSENDISWILFAVDDKVSTKSILYLAQGIVCNYST